MRILTAATVALLIIASSGLLRSVSCQIVEEKAAAPEIYQDSSSGGDRGCFPPCRKGFTCHNGQCVSLCNPPCEQGMECGEDGNCHPSSVPVRGGLESVTGFRVVQGRKELSQGIALSTNVPRARAKVGDTVFEFGQELFLVAPTGSYSVDVDAPGRFIDHRSADVRPGEVDELNFRLRPFKVNISLAFGPAWMPKSVVMEGDLALGVNILTKHYVGVTGFLVAPLFYSAEYMNDTGDFMYPDTTRETGEEMYGIGLTYGYTGFTVLHNFVTVIPQISVGSWRYDDATYYYQRFGNRSTDSTYTIPSLEHHHYEHYYARPALEMRLGHRSFSFDAKAAAYIGTGRPIVSVCIGFVVAFP
jgi:hypothetical protein